MIKNDINVEGILGKEALKTISLKECKILNSNYVIKILNNTGLKDIYQITIESNIKESDTLYFKDSSMISIAFQSIFKVLYVEDTTLNNVSYIQSTAYFNELFENNFNNAQKIDIFVIDAFFNIINQKEISCNLTYLFKFSTEDSFEGVKINKKCADINQSFILLNREFY